MSKHNSEYGMPNELPWDTDVLGDVERIAQLEFELGEKYQQELRELNELSIQKQALQNANLPPNSKTYRDAQKEIERVDAQMKQRYAKLENKSPKVAEKPKVEIPDFASRVADAIPTVKRKDRITRSERQNLLKWLYGAVGSGLLIWGANFAYSNLNKPKYVTFMELHFKKFEPDFANFNGELISEEVYIESMLDTIGNIKHTKGNLQGSFRDNLLVLKQVFEKNKDSKYCKELFIKINKIAEQKEAEHLKNIDMTSDERDIAVEEGNYKGTYQNK
jgi:hypothetical protein